MIAAFPFCRTMKFFNRGSTKPFVLPLYRYVQIIFQFLLLELEQTSWAGTDVGFLYLSPSHQWYSYLKTKSISDNLSENALFSIPTVSGGI